MGVPNVTSHPDIARAAVKARASVGVARSTERPFVAAGGQGDGMMSFNPPRRPASAELTHTDRKKLAARARFAVNNNGYAAGSVEREVDAVVGAQFRPSPKPDARALGLSEDDALQLRADIRSRWRAWADNPLNLADVTRSQSLGQVFGTAYRSYIIEGDALVEIAWRTDRDTQTCVRLIDPDLLSNPHEAEDTAFLRQGVELDGDGAAVGYHFRAAHEHTAYATTDTMRWVRLERETSWGRPVIAHHFDKQRDGQTRGISHLAPILEKLGMEESYARTELQAAILNAMFALYVKSPLDSNTLMEALSDKEMSQGVTAFSDAAKSYHEESKIIFNGARIPHLFPGEEFEAITAQRPAAQFEAFTDAVLRNVATGRGQSLEQFTGDWSKVNYSSARAAMVEIWRRLTSRRRTFAHGFCQPVYLAWLEEEIVEGKIRLPAGAPDFHDAWQLYARAKWVGPGKGFVDPVKEAQASAMRVALGLSTLEDEAAELTGDDWDENLAQLNAEIALMPERVLHPAQESFAKLIGGAAPSDRPET